MNLTAFEILRLDGWRRRRNHAKERKMNSTNAPLTAVGDVLPTARYNQPIGSLRAFIVALVVAHHAALAYYPYAPASPASLVDQPRWWEAFPIRDTHLWGSSAALTGFNDIFFMSLMFFLSGLFVWNSLEKKGAAAFVRDRLLRLGLPFIVSAGLLAPLAYYPAYLQSTHSTGFWQEWLSLGQWPAGPAWFLWVLLAFDGIVALLFILAPRWGQILGALTSGADRRPALFFTVLLSLSAITYIPMALHFSSLSWTAYGPFTFQTSRILHYLLYFLIAVGVGAYGVNRGLLAPDGKLARRWPLWVAAALLLFAAAAAATVIVLTTGSQSRGLVLALHTGFVLSCAASCFAFLALFLRFAQSGSRFFRSLSANSFAIYLVHYVFVNWLQYTMLPAALPGVAKWVIVFLGALALSWATAAGLRRIPGVGRVV
jgi:peptidoglycan/LPS O-acetylase OafA/YrhL